MTREEAIKIIYCYDIGFYDLSGEKIPADKLAEAFDMAIEALHREEAEENGWCHRIKPKEYLPSERTGEWTYLSGSKGSYMTISCPICGSTFNDVAEWKYNYCPNCGARMKGGDDE